MKRQKRFQIKDRTSAPGQGSVTMTYRVLDALPATPTQQGADRARSGAAD